MPDKNPCDKCNAKCCRYIALEIDPPEDRDTQENIRWYLSHKGVQVYVEDGKWHLQVNTKCRHLDKNNRCTIYDDRPKICRSYKTGNCENSDAEYDYELHFKSDSEFEAYLAEKKKKDKKRKNDRAKRRANDSARSAGSNNHAGSARNTIRRAERRKKPTSRALPSGDPA